ncbi:hypothetical protein [Enterobacter asburiae]|uniref:hypothetical protein n=1 Tax=Enterobacter asburiae TaxID=61645 RepID=UPI00301DE0B0
MQRHTPSGAAVTVTNSAAAASGTPAAKTIAAAIAVHHREMLRSMVINEFRFVFNMNFRLFHFGFPVYFFGRFRLTHFNLSNNIPLLAVLVFQIIIFTG